MTRRLVLCFNGTAIPSKPSRGILHRLLYNPKNIIQQIFENCQISDKFIFDGPGTAIFRDDYPISSASKYIHSLMGLLYGGIGINNIYDTIKAALAHVKEIAKHDSVEIYLFGWSRSTLTIDFLTSEINRLVTAKQIKVVEIHRFLIDPVAGSFLDRFDMYRYAQQAVPNRVKINSVIYYSTSGNLDLWERYSLFPVNQPFFSTIDFVSPSEKYILAGNHEDVCGHSRDHSDPNNLKRIVGDIVIGHMIAKLAHTLLFNESFQRRILNRGIEAVGQYIKMVSKELNTSRRFLSNTNLWCSFMGKPLSQVENIEVVSKMHIPMLSKL